MSELTRRRWLGAAGWLAALAAAGGTQMRDPAVASAQGGSAESLLAALKSARVFDLSFTWSEAAPVLSLNPPYSFALNRTHKMTHEIFGQVPGSRVSWASDIMYFSGQHGSPTLDAIGHIGRDLKLHGGVDAVAATATPGRVRQGALQRPHDAAGRPRHLHHGERQPRSARRRPRRRGAAGGDTAQDPGRLRLAAARAGAWLSRSPPRAGTRSTGAGGTSP